MSILRNFQLLKIIYTSFIIFMIVFPGFTSKSLDVNNSPVKTIINSVVKVEKAKEAISSPQVEIIEKNILIQKIQDLRKSIGLQELIVDESMCEVNLIDEYIKTQSLSDNQFNLFCPTCSVTAYVGTMGNYAVRNKPDWIESEDIIELIVGEYSHTCVQKKDEAVLIFFGNIEKKSAEVKEFYSSEILIKDFSMEDLWQALVDYRHAHTSPDLQYSQSLCAYAQRRVDEHIKMYSEKTIEEYENKDKYPLDAHSGFRRDGESGEVFDITGFNVVAENLAYWPTAEFPHQVIEWGWDTSTEGHKEAQLSTEYSHACLAGNQGFYVAIFARN